MEQHEEINFLREKVQALQTENAELKVTPVASEVEQYKQVIVEMNRVFNSYGSAISDLFGHDEEFLKLRNEMRRISGDPAYCPPDSEN